TLGRGPATRKLCDQLVGRGQRNAAALHPAQRNVVGHLARRATTIRDDLHLETVTYQAQCRIDGTHVVGDASDDQLFASGRLDRCGEMLVVHAVDDAKDTRRGPARLGWAVSTVRVILRNEKYASVWVWNPTRYLKDPDSGRRRPIRRPADEWIRQGVEHLKAEILRLEHEAGNLVRFL